MARDEDHFWSNYFEAFPVIKFFVALFAIAAGVAGGVCFRELALFGRVQVLFIVSATSAGAGVGLVVGVFVDTVLDVLRGVDKTKRKKNIAERPHPAFGMNAMDLAAKLAPCQASHRAKSRHVRSLP
jgi:hypothetical protein